jgi:hypothetical protein
MNSTNQSTPLKQAILDNVRRWRMKHGLEPDSKPFRNEPRFVKIHPKRNVVIDIVAEVKPETEPKP